eukprot:412062_1
MELNQDTEDVHSGEQSVHSGEQAQGIATTNVSVAVNDDIENIDDDVDDHLNKVPSPRPREAIDPLYRIHSNWKTLFIRIEFISRISILIVSVFLLTLAIAYCIAPWYKSTLKLVSLCEGKDIEDIRQHSYQSGLVNGDVTITPASHGGITDEACWTTKTLETNTENLWDSNVYDVRMRRKYLNSQFIAFGCLMLTCFCLIVYILCTLVADCVHVSRNDLHTISNLYQDFENQKQTKKASPPKHENCYSWCVKHVSPQWQHLNVWWLKLMASDTTGWIVKGLISELVEIVIQTNALLLYNGFNILDPTNKDDIYLANRSNIVKIFAVILSFNLIGSGILWLSYACVPKRCYGLIFRVSLFFVDSCSDLFYTMFPFIIVMYDEYNANAYYTSFPGNYEVLLAQLNTQSQSIAIVSSFVPLFLLIVKSLSNARATREELVNKYYVFWKIILDISKQTDDKQAIYRAKLDGFNVNISSLQNNNKEIFKGSKLDLQITKNKNRANWVRNEPSDHDTDNEHKGHKWYELNRKQCVLVFIALAYIIYGVVLIPLVFDHLDIAQKHCQIISESTYYNDGEINITRAELNDEEQYLLEGNPELFFWDKCLYKVYPFFHDNECQCRVFAIDWSETQSTEQERVIHFNITQPMIFSNALAHWTHLEKFRTNGLSSVAGTTITKSMFAAKHMKAFEWTDAKIRCLQLGISNWKRLEYFKLKAVKLSHQIPNDFDGLESMKYLSLHSNGLTALPPSICELKYLQILEIVEERKIQTIPKCISNLSKLKQLIADNCLQLQDIPLSVFALPELVTLSLFHGSITLQSLIQYNVPNNIRNDTNASVEWLRNTFEIAPNIEEHYLQYNPICIETVQWFPSEYNGVMTASCERPCNANDTNQLVSFCSPRLLGDGKCDPTCEHRGCWEDFGDCTQLCFVPQISNCTFDLYSNDICDEPCDNKYCAKYSGWGVSYGTPRATDNSKCSIEGDDVASLSCMDSNSTYVTKAFVAVPDFINPLSYTPKCEDRWIGDSICDDLCRTTECNQDGGDCDTASCVGDMCELIYSVWLNFVDASTYNINISYFCGVIAPTATAMAGFDPLAEYGIVCENATELYDWNHDLFVNFREFTGIAFWWAGGKLTATKAKQVNCSDCIGMEYYDISVDNNDWNEISATSIPTDECDAIDELL